MGVSMPKRASLPADVQITFLSFNVKEQRHCGRSEAIHDFRLYGLPRCARSDDILRHCEPAVSCPIPHTDLEPCGADFSLPWSTEVDPTICQSNVFMERSAATRQSRGQGCMDCRARARPEPVEGPAVSIFLHDSGRLGDHDRSVTWRLATTVIRACRADACQNRREIT